MPPTENPTPPEPTLTRMPVEISGLIATLPDYAAIDLSEVRDLIELVYPKNVPNVIQLFLLLTNDDQAFVVVAALDARIDRFITAGM
ncbi:MAG: hypothetical protein IIC24_10910, partial [Chloroflexi bacterium]|nr:hypothetical protein [Chloroflexota bacterium]